MAFEKILPEEINENFIKSIGSEWMLITAGNKESRNTMTASWGFVGVMWGNPTAIAAIRPQRYTLEFVEKQEYYTLSFYGDNKKIHSICGKYSGRDKNKEELAGLTPEFDSKTGAPYYKEARLVLICKKVYEQQLEKKHFFNRNLTDSVYPNNDYHKMIYGTIVSAYINK